MCLNHWLPFLPVPVILLNANWFADCEKLRERYRHDVATGYHPGGDCPARYVMAHEIAHFLYVRMGRKERKKWEKCLRAREAFRLLDHAGGKLLRGLRGESRRARRPAL